MRAVTNDGGFRTVEVPEPGGEGVRVDVAAAGICGSDLMMGALGLGGFVVGHEFAGTVDGRPVFVEPTLHCGRCAECRRGDTGLCTGPGRGILGVFVDGGMADRAVVPEYTLLDLPAGLDARDASLVETGAVGWRAVRRAAVRPGERLLVVGGGAVGLLAAAAAQAAGLGVDVEARHDHQRRAADRLGHGRPRGGYDVVIDAAGGPTSLTRCVEAVRPGGRVVVTGAYTGMEPVPGVPSLNKEITYVHSFVYGRHAGERETAHAARMLAARPELAATLITHRFPIDRATEAFRTAADRAAGAIKVVVEP